jgi:hypothetical protein
MMKTRHAAAFALVGWYLMLPPPIGSSGVATEVPLTQWKTFGFYPTKEACEQAKQNLLPGPTRPSSDFTDQQILSVQASRCVSSDADLGQSPTS